MAEGELTSARPLPVSENPTEQGPPGSGTVPGTGDCSIKMCESVRQGQGELDQHRKEGSKEYESTEARVTRGGTFSARRGSPGLSA